MATTVAAKRMARERVNLEKPNNDYIVHFPDDNLFKLDAYIIGPSDSLYAHKFVKVHFDIPHDYPLSPPKCKFIQHAGGRIHPNLYVDGKVCLSILGTWQGEKWALAMTCETVLITIRSLLDNKPYTHEPGQKDSADYNNFVQYSTWRWLLLDYLRNERVPKFQRFLQTYVAEHGDAIMAELRQQAVRNTSFSVFNCIYDRRSSQVVNYPALESDVRDCVEQCRAASAPPVPPAPPAATAAANELDDQSAERENVARHGVVVVIDED